MHTLFVVFIIISSSYTCTYTPCLCKHVCYTEFKYIYSSKKASFNFWQFCRFTFLHLIISFRSRNSNHRHVGFPIELNMHKHTKRIHISSLKFYFSCTFFVSVYTFALVARSRCFFLFCSFRFHQWLRMYVCAKLVF